ncbi:MAG TPA: transposase, partial [Segetibacter sp.]|nr:transposase [Segetibacter sp.]
MCIILEGEVIQRQQIKNKEAAIGKWLKQTQKQYGYLMQNSLFTMEFTGIYNHHLLEVLHKAGANIWLIPGLEINASRGLQRSKNDKEDAKLIAEYAMKNLKKVRLWKKPRTVLKQLAALLMMREKLMISKHQYETTLKEHKSFSTKEEYQVVKDYSALVLKNIHQQLKRIDNQIKDAIQGDERLKELNEYITSVDGVGLITSVNTIVETNEFLDISEAKKFSNHSGVVPHTDDSGKKIKKPKVSHKANKKMKKLLHLAAMSVIRKKGELKDYYERKIAEGKNKMSVLNAVRNKLVLRIFACVNNK